VQAARRNFSDPQEVIDVTGIQWTNETWNPIVGCTVVSPGCKNCYAMRDAARLARIGSTKAKYAGLTDKTKTGWVWNGNVRFWEPDLNKPLIDWTSPRLIFVNSMSDLAHEGVLVEWFRRIWQVMVEARATRGHIFQILTKRPENLLRLLAAIGVTTSVPGIWLGVSAEDQRRWNERVPFLREFPTTGPWVSAEPQLTLIEPDLSGVGWLVQGGESGAGARPFDLGWARVMRDRCREAGVPYFLKQVGKIAELEGQRFPTKHRKGGDPREWPDDLRIRECPDEIAAHQLKDTTTKHITNNEAGIGPGHRGQSGTTKAAPAPGQHFTMPTTRAPHEIGSSKATTMIPDVHTAGDAQNLDGSDRHAAPSHSVPAMIPAADGVDIQSARRHLQSLALSLKTASTIDEVKQLHGRADALRVYLYNMGAALELQNEAAEVKIRIERRVGEELASRRKPVGGRPSGRTSDIMSSVSDADARPATLAELRIDAKQSSRWQELASIPPERFEDHITNVKDRGSELTTESLRRLAKRLKKEARQARHSTTAEQVDDEDLATDREDAGSAGDAANQNAAKDGFASPPFEAQTPEVLTGSGDRRLREMREIPHPEPHQGDVGQDATQPGESPQDLVRPAGIIIDQPYDPYRDGANANEVQRCAAVAVPQARIGRALRQEKTVPERQHASGKHALASDRRAEDLLNRLAALSSPERALVIEAAVDRWGAPAMEEPAVVEDDDDGPTRHDQCIDLAALKSGCDDVVVAKSVTCLIDTALYAPNAPKIPAPDQTRELIQTLREWLDRLQGTVEAQRARDSIIVNPVANGEVSGSETAGVPVDKPNSGSWS
jgi:protein gp37